MCQLAVPIIVCLDVINYTEDVPFCCFTRDIVCERTINLLTHCIHFFCELHICNRNAVEG